ncbi:cilia- and flagella-associated protein 58-like [Selaginella moellendorffii]|uniref:cilia- and flagella-associated protein 58-like n=1 Tax=Selaginella moellendorffii TaxID=88036 RepID=UPI000D1D1009|nr:cilia- and flagella-associated protein 58-like [Selaginella moellendorffii]XP_024521489.1 cilia- and flagella-associated protein 58-like [Selaginella moellendorffii]|eukprot:XP_024519422.1 cilia- and flagella-associated protein 58-like [Selaginella moellendorffii]
MADDDEEAVRKEKLRAQEAMGGFELKAFEALERDFQEVLQELQADKSLDRFRIEYEKLHRALKKSHESEKRLIKKCRELNTEILANASKVQNALKLNEEDQNTILALKKEIDKAWKMVDASQEKEAKAKDNILQLKTEIANLSQIIEQGCGLSMGQEQELNELLKQKEDLTLERDLQLDQIVQLRKEVTDLSEKQKVAEEQKISMEQDVASLREQIAAKKSESEREQKKKERMEKDIKDLKMSLEAKQNDIRVKQATLTENEEQVARLELALREQRQATEKAQKELDIVTQKVTKLHGDLEEQIHGNTQLLAENSQKQVEMKLKDEEIQVLKSEIARVNKIREATVNKLKGAEKAKEDVEKQRDSVKSDVVNLERELEAQRKLTEQERKRQEDLLRERDVLNKLKTQAETAIEKQSDLVKINEVAVHNLEIEIQTYRQSSAKQEKVIQQLEKERQKYGAEATQAGVKYMQALDEVKSREVTIMELQKKILEAENKYKIQQNLYESVRSERNLYSKNLVEAQDQIDELRRRIKIMNHQIEQLKEEINAKDQALIKEHADHAKIEKEREALKQDLSKIHQEIREAESVIGSHLSTIENLNHIISEADDERSRQKKELDVIKSERDILGTQLMRRNEELALLYEKIKIQQSTLTKGQVQYRCRLNELRLLKIKITDLKREQSILKGSVNNIQVLKREVHNLSRELLQERTKVKALSEELENPLNVHRWRQLEGTDPSAYEMILKIQTLQKRLILKTEQVVEKDLLIQEKEKLYVELRNILARQPGPEMVEQLAVYSKSLKEKTRQMKAMASELQMYQGQVYGYKAEIEQLKGEIDSVKKKFFEHKKKEQLERERRKDLDSQGSNFSSGNNPLNKGFLGGGYNLQST